MQHRRVKKENNIYICSVAFRCIVAKCCICCICNTACCTLFSQPANTKWSNQIPRFFAQNIPTQIKFETRIHNDIIVATLDKPFDKHPNHLAIYHSSDLSKQIPTLYNTAIGQGTLSLHVEADGYYILCIVPFEGDYCGSSMFRVLESKVYVYKSYLRKFKNKKL